MGIQRPARAGPAPPPPSGGQVPFLDTPVTLGTDPRQLRTALAAFATGVTVVTIGGDQPPHGMTANAVASVSLDPPLVLVCVSHDARMHQAMAAAGGFAISVLAAHQAPVARHFASSRRPLGAAQFTTVDWSPGGQTGAPLIGGAVAWLECAVCGIHEAGDHSIYIGQLVWVARVERGEPLLFFDSQFRRLAQEVDDGSGR